MPSGSSIPQRDETGTLWTVISLTILDCCLVVNISNDY